MLREVQERVSRLQSFWFAICVQFVNCVIPFDLAQLLSFRGSYVLVVWGQAPDGAGPLTWTVGRYASKRFAEVFVGLQVEFLSLVVEDYVESAQRIVADDAIGIVLF